LLSAGVVRQPVHEFLQFGLKATEIKKFGVGDVIGLTQSVGH
jgi:hypothetical protein